MHENGNFDFINTIHSVMQTKFQHFQNWKCKRLNGSRFTCRQRAHLEVFDFQIILQILILDKHKLK